MCGRPKRSRADRAPGSLLRLRLVLVRERPFQASTIDDRRSAMGRSVSVHSPSPGEAATNVRRAGLIGVALLLPRVGVVVVAVALPEAKPILGQELDTAQPLGALPEILLWCQGAQRIAVL